jgi:hypothetical protein
MDKIELTPERIDEIRRKKNLAVAKWRKKNKIKESLYQKKYRSKPENKEKHKINEAIRRAANPEKTREINYKSWKKNSDKYNKIRKIKYHTDNEFRRKKDASDKNYRKSEKGQIMLHKPENMQRAKERNKNYRILFPEKTKFKNLEYRLKNRESLMLRDIKRRKNLEKSYIATCMRIKTNELTPDITETRKLIIQLKRELKQLNIKTK